MPKYKYPERWVRAWFKTILLLVNNWMYITALVHVAIDHMFLWIVVYCNAGTFLDMCLTWMAHNTLLCAATTLSQLGNVSWHLCLVYIERFYYQRSSYRPLPAFYFLYLLDDHSVMTWLMSRHSQTVFYHSLYKWMNTLVTACKQMLSVAMLHINTVGDFLICHWWQ